MAGRPSRKLRINRNPLGRELAVLALLFLIALAGRAYAFTQSVIDWDESLYALVAREMLAGHLPYVTAWECKPPVLFAIFAAGFKAFGTSVAAYRWLSVFAAVGTAYFLYRIGTRFAAGPQTTGFVAAGFFLALSLADGGIAANAELFDVVFVSLGVWLLLRSPSSALVLALAGISFGIAVGVKQTAAIPVAALCTVALMQRRLDWRGLGILSGGFALTTLATLIPFVAGGGLGAYLDANLSANVRRLELPRPAMNLAGVAAVQLWELAPAIEIVLIAALAALLGRRTRTVLEDRALVTLAAAWSGAALLTVAAIGDYSGHQFVEAMPGLALLAAAALVRISFEWPTPRRTLALAGCLIFAFAAHGAWFAVRGVAIARGRAFDPTYGDPVASLAVEIHHRIGANRSLFVASGEPVLYLLLALPLPTRYPYPPHFSDSRLAAVAGNAGGRELRRVLALTPDYIVYDPSAPPLDGSLARLEQQTLAHNYGRVAPGLYHRRDGEGAFVNRAATGRR